MSTSLVPEGHFTTEQQTELEACAIPLAKALTLGIRNAASMDDLPDYARKYVDGDREVLPALVFAWTSASGRTVEQVKPVAPILNGDDTRMKYLWPKGEPPVIHLASDPAEPRLCLVVEGTKQSRAAALYAPPATRVVGLGGCYNWMVDGITSPELEDAMEDLPVVVCLDADMRTNPAVYEAAVRLKKVAEQAGAKSVKFIKLTSGSAAESMGLDDYLGSRAPEKRASRLANLIGTAENLTAKEKPKGKAPSASGPVVVGGRLMVNTDADAWDSTIAIHKALTAKWDGEHVFNFGGILTRLQVDEDGLTITEPMGPEHVDALIHATCRIVEGPDDKPTLIKPGIRNMIRSEVRRWTTLAGVVRNPFVRPDGTVCTASGYDPSTRYLVALTEELEGLHVPEDPEPEEVAAAVKLLFDEWLVDFPFHTPADWANALAFVLTPFIRGSVPVVPLAVIDGLQMGVGKGLFIDCVYLMLHGRPTAPTPWTENEEEQRKVITSLFRSGADLFAYDEAHSLSGSPLAQAITGSKWQDRKLGGSDMVEFPNNVTWASMGNNVQVHGDLRRRVYPIRLEPKGADPDRRPASSFRHPDIKGWTVEHRTELLQACLTLVRSWYANGKVEAVTDFGSFERWQATVGGILDNANVNGFLDNLRGWLDSGDSSHGQWVRHYHWLAEMFPDQQEFTASEVAQKLTVLGLKSDEMFPPEIEVKDGKVSARRIGQRYGYRKGQIAGGMRLVSRKDAITKWHIEMMDEPTDPPPDDPAPTSDPDPGITEVRTDAEPMVFDLETNGLDVYGERDFSRIVGYTDGPDVTVGTDHEAVLRAVEDGTPLAAHNGFQFDFHALAEHHGLDMLYASERGLLWDTKVMASLSDPPPFDMKPEHIEKHYSLDNVATRLGVSVKTDSIERLAEKYGGYGNIPVDDPEYIAYCRGDVGSTVEVLGGLGQPTPYMMREFQLLGRLASSVTQIGFRVDTDLLQQRLDANAAKAAEKKAWLAERYPLPTTRKDGSESSSPHRTNEGKAALIEAFKSLGANPDRWPNPGKTGPSLGKETLLWLHDLATRAGKDDVVALCEVVMELNGIRTVYQTVADTMVDGRVHPTISARQASGRLSITKPGLTVFGKHNGRHIERSIFLPEPGHVLIAADLSQVDMRAIAGLCQDKAYMQLFEPGRDAHTEIATAVWGDPGRRTDAKKVGHGWNYGMGIRNLVEKQKVSRDTAQEFDQQMRENYPDLVLWKEEVKAIAETGELMDNGFGRLMRPDPARAHTQGPALMGQGAARDLMMDGILRLPVEIVPMMRAVVHDEVVFSVPEDVVVDVSRAVREAFETEWRGVPILTDVTEPGADWGEVSAK